MEARENELELARVGHDVADGEDARHIGLERLGVDGDKVALEVEARSGDRTELHLETIEGEESVARQPLLGAIVALDGHGLDLRLAAAQPSHLTDDQLHRPGIDQASHLLDRVGDARNSSRRWTRPCCGRSAAGWDRVERRSAAAGHHHPPVAGMPPSCGRRRRARRSRRPRRPAGGCAAAEAAGPGGDHHDRCSKIVPSVVSAPAAVIQTLQALGLLAEMGRRLEGLDLLHQIVDQLLARAARHGRDVIDRLVGWSSAHWPPILSRLSTSWQRRPRRPASNTAKRPTGPAPMITMSVRMTSSGMIAIAVRWRSLCRCG